MENTKDHIDNYPERFKRDYAKRVSQKQDMSKKVKYLQSRGEKFSIEITNSNYKLSSDLWKKSSYKKSSYTPYELHFIKEVRRHVMKNEIYVAPEFEEQIYRRDIKYIDVKRASLGDVYHKVVEIDLDEAYWRTARVLGIINQEIYDKGKKGKISKQSRLTALGTLAKKTTIMHYEGYKLVKKELRSEPLLENLWYTICKRISDVMTSAQEALGKDFIFYWVDGIYAIDTEKNRKIVADIFTQAGYGVKFQEIPKVEFTDRGWVTQDSEDENDTRFFSYPHYATGKKKSYMESINLTDFVSDVISNNRDLVGEIMNKVKEQNKDGKK